MIEVVEVKSPYFKGCRCNACLIEEAKYELLIGRPKAQVHYLLCGKCMRDVKDAIEKATKIVKEEPDERGLGDQK